MKRTAFIVLCLLLSVASAPAAEQRKANASSIAADAVRAVIATPENKIDLAKAKLAFDRMVDPKINARKALKKIELMHRAVRALAGPSPSEAQKLTALRKYIYESGDWNGRKAFSYDMSDPYGRQIGNKLLTTYLATRRGNCVSMPILLMILGQGLGLKMTLAVAPNHVFVKYTEAASGKTYNLEATSGGYPARDTWYRQNMLMSDQAIRSGLYMKALTKREALALMGAIVMEFLMTQERFEEAERVADVIVEFSPTNVGAILTQGTAAMERIERRVQDLYPNPGEISPATRAQFQAIIDAKSEPFRRAEALGWRETDGAPMQNLHRKSTLD
jgi:regulator of sirC expression with transglutaminase-like and TPR domain